MVSYMERLKASKRAVSGAYKINDYYTDFLSPQAKLKW